MTTAAVHEPTTSRDDRVRDEAEDRRRLARKARREGRAAGFSEATFVVLTPKERGAFDLYRDGLSTSQIGERLGIARESARERIARAWAALANAVAGVVPVQRSTIRDLSPADTQTLSRRAQQAHAMWGSGSSYAAIAQSLDCTESAARSLLQRLRRTLERTGPGATAS